MRIIAGDLGGRVLAAPRTRGTRPMTDKVRGALFNILGPVEGLDVLDAYAGSGALGFEALSRGADHVVAIEAGREASSTIRKNVEGLGVGGSYELIEGKVENWLSHAGEAGFDLVFAMPPYELLEHKVLAALAQHTKATGLMVVEYPRGFEPFEFPGLRLEQVRSYGDPHLAFYVR